jgi:hypothetical protein
VHEQQPWTFRQASTVSPRKTGHRGLAARALLEEAARVALDLLDPISRSLNSDEKSPSIVLLDRKAILAAFSPCHGLVLAAYRLQIDASEPGPSASPRFLPQAWSCWAPDSRTVSLRHMPLSFLVTASPICDAASAEGMQASRPNTRVLRPRLNAANEETAGMCPSRRPSGGRRKRPQACTEVRPAKRAQAISVTRRAGWPTPS